MSSITYTDSVTVIPAAWLNDVNTLAYTLFGDGTNYTGRLIIADTTDSTSSTTGSIKTAGGLGIAKALNVGTTATITGTFTANGNVALGNAAGDTLRITSDVATLDANGLLTITGNGSGGITVACTGTQLTMTRTAVGSTSIRTGGSAEFIIAANGSDRVSVLSGVQVGAPTGGDKGSGTANFAADIYKNNTAYTNPDYVLEHWATGKIEKYAHKDGAKEYAGLRSLGETEAFARKNLHLPGFGQDAGHGAFSGADALLASVEEAYLHLFALKKELDALRAEFAAYKESRLGAAMEKVG